MTFSAGRAHAAAEPTDKKKSSVPAYIKPAHYVAIGQSDGTLLLNSF